MNSTYQGLRLEKAIGLSIGFLIGVIPVAEYNIPVLITLMSVVFGIKHVDRQAIKAAIPVILLREHDWSNGLSSRRVGI